MTAAAMNKQLGDFPLRLLVGLCDFLRKALLLEIEVASLPNLPLPVVVCPDHPDGDREECSRAPGEPTVQRRDVVLVMRDRAGLFRQRRLLIYPSGVRC